MVSDTVQSRIRKIGNLVHQAIPATGSEAVEAELRKRIEASLGKTEFLSMSGKEVEELLEILRSLGAVEIDNVRRKLPRGDGKRHGWLGYENWNEFVRFATPVIESGIRYRKVKAVDVFEKGAFVFDKTLD